MARARRPAGALDQAGDVGDDELPSVGDSTVPSTGCSVVNGYSATLGRAFEIQRQERRLAGVREADERRVCEQLQMQLDARAPRRADPPLRTAAPGGSSWRSARCRARPARRAAARRAPGCARSASSSSSSNTCVPTGTRTSASSPSAPCLRAPAPLPPFAAAIRPHPRTLDEVAQLGIGEQHDVAAVAAVTAVGPTLGHVLLAPEARASVAALPALTWIWARSLNTDALGLRRATSTTVTERRRRCGANSALPSRIAKIVSSRPIFVPGPGRNRAPLADDDLAGADRPGRRTS